MCSSGNEVGLLTSPELSKLLEAKDLPALLINICSSQRVYVKVLMEHTRDYENTVLTF